MLTEYIEQQLDELCKNFGLEWYWNDDLETVTVISSATGNILWSTKPEKIFGKFKEE